MSDFRWTEQTERAASLLAAANLSMNEIAQQLDVTRQTIWNWRQHPDFKARVDQYLEELREDIKRIGIADQLKRVAALNDRWNRMRQVIEARADDPNMERAPGGRTGLLVRVQKMLGSGESAMPIEEFALDTGLLKELREHEKQAAIELGQWQADKPSDELRAGRPAPIQFVKLVKTVPVGSAEADAVVITPDPSDA